MQKTTSNAVETRVSAGEIGRWRTFAIISYPDAEVAARWVESDGAELKRRFIDKHRTMFATDATARWCSCRRALDWTRPETIGRNSDLQPI